MAEPTLIWLAEGSLSAAAAEDIRVRWQDSAGEVNTATLAEMARHCGPQGIRLVLSVCDVLVTDVALNRKQARHLQRVLPWLLEDQLIDAPDRLWFASGKPASGHYPVVACDRANLQRLQQLCAELGLWVRGVSVDVQLLEALAPALVPVDQQWLVVAENHQGLMVPDKDRQAFLSVLGLDELPEQPLSLAELFQVMAASVRSGRHLELLQGELRPAEQGSGPQLSDSWRRLLVMAAASIVLVGILMMAQTWRYNAAAEQHWQQAAALYNQLFPGDRAQALLETQFRNRLSQLGGASQGGFMALMVPVGESLAGRHSSGLAAKRIQYDERDNALTVDIEAADYDSLEALRSKISDGGLNAEIANYRSQGETVTARLRVTAGS
ncbi:MAG: type II secretion system protein GspL [Alcanivoracaceae bacterium]|jgi:general secretion pathway protein L|nr:type II secretion system protein GspL [Alcanivoracaceae bacterium]